jgi:MoaD family protein
MRIKVRGYLTLRDVVGARPVREIEAERLTVTDLVRQLSEEVGEALTRTGSDGRRSLIILVNGRHCSHLPDGLDTELADGDEVAIFPPVAGG